MLSFYRVRKAFMLKMTLAVLAIGLLLTACYRRPPSRPAMTPQVSVVTVKRERVVLTTELPGRTAAYRVAQIRPRVSGLIQKRLFTEGSDVRAGQLLYRIDPAPYQAAYDRAKAAVAVAEANLPALRSRVQRFKKLVDVHAVGQQDYDDAFAALQQMEAQLNANKAAMESARINLSYTPITAPISGRIGRSSVTEGALVNAYQPTPLATIQQLDPIYVDVPQSTADLHALQRRLADGRLSRAKSDSNRVTLLMEDGSPYPLEGTLQFRDVSVDPTTGSVTLRMVFPNPDHLLLPGMFVRAVVQEGVNEKAILLPQETVSRTPKGDPFVLIVDDAAKVQVRMVTLDRAVGNKWLVSGGLAPGERVIIEGVQFVRPGMAVKAVPFGSIPSGPGHGPGGPDQGQKRPEGEN